MRVAADRRRAVTGLAWSGAAALAIAWVGCAVGRDGHPLDRRGRPPPPAGEATGPYYLSETGLYADPAAPGALAAGLLAFTPAHELWSDGAEKRRWIWLPPGQAIDTRDMDHWRFPVGTRVWKEFRRGGRLLETRMIQRTGPGPGDYWMGAFVWDQAGRDAVFVEQGEADVLGTDHDVPPAGRCPSCHGGEPGRVLGFSALQLAGAHGPSPPLDDVAAQGRLSHPPPAPGDWPAVAGDLRARAALGYLHANCGHCHGDTGLAFREVDLVLRLRAGVRAVEETDTYRTTVRIPMQRAPLGGGHRSRIAPGRPDASGLLARMSALDASARMPPLGTEHADRAGVELVAAWITGLAQLVQDESSPTRR